MISNRREKQDKINNIIKFLANKIFYNSKDFKYSNAFDKLKARFYLDWGIKISDRLKEYDSRSIAMYDTLSDSELDKLLISSNNLLNMYKSVIESKVS